MSDEEIARVVFGEARGEPYQGQLGVAYTIFNRSRHPGYLNSPRDILYERATDGRHKYETLDDAGHTQAWSKAKQTRNDEYTSAMRAAQAARSGSEPDPTRGATDFASKQNWPSVSDNQYWRATNKTQIGNQWFVGREKK
ncbi:uncharacterized protein LOC127835376 [Dreissena polymorpha]|uniref:Cell wall hydrolase SleB domain-containing protein n=1 Tax=Dreissena polymorpha TaxID=45954 RepID=A0A9D4GE55_DREPO|nr:uncharacterized protein LOC127835376 [Dreissena polymorpha]KAH3815470.1 hypothetical protein DPMN_143993 [Dreissena polymorpha]